MVFKAFSWKISVENNNFHIYVSVNDQPFIVRVCEVILKLQEFYISQIKASIFKPIYVLGWNVSRKLLRNVEKKNTEYFARERHQKVIDQ